MMKGITRVTLDVSANAGDLWAWPPQRAGLFARVPAPVAHIDCAIPVMHGMNGEDGTLQGLLELLLGDEVHLHQHKQNRFYRICLL